MAGSPRPIAPPTVYWSPSLATGGRLGLVFEAPSSFDPAPARPAVALPSDAIRLVPAPLSDLGARVAALLRRCEAIDASTWTEADGAAAGGAITTREVWALLANPTTTTTEETSNA